MLPGFCSRGHMVLKKKLLEEFQDGCLMHGHLWYLNGMIWAIQALYFALVSAQEDIWFGRRYCLKYWRQLPWWHNNDSAGCRSTIPCLMPNKFSHCAQQRCRWFLEFRTVQKSNLTTLSLSNIYTTEPFYTYWYYATRQHTKTLFCGEIIFQYL